jgi:hypothetical protein
MAMRSRRIRWAGHLAHAEEIINKSTILAKDMGRKVCLIIGRIF